jgi:hypothetical protein
MKTYRPEHHRRQRPIGPLALIFGGSLILVAIVAFVLIGRNTGSGVPANFQPEAEGPRVSIDRQVIDFGKRPLNVPVEATFRVRNVGSQDLRILDTPQIQVLEGCCPPEVLVGKMNLEPGEETTVSMSFSMHEGMDGPHDFRLHLRTNDPQEPEKELKVLSDWGD